MNHYTDNNNLEYKISDMLTTIPSGTFISATPTSGLSIYNFPNNSIINSSDNQYLSPTGYNLYSGLSTDSLTANYQSLNYPLGGYHLNNEFVSYGGATNYQNMDNIYTTINIPKNPLFIDKCSSQFFTETGLMQDFAYACVTNNLTNIVTYPNLAREYKQNSITLSTILFNYGWTILKTSTDNYGGGTHVGERELIDYISNNQNLQSTATVISGEKGVIKKCFDAGIKIINNWEFVIFMIIKKIISWSRAEKIYKCFGVATEYNNHQNYKMKGYETLEDYYIKNQKNIIKKLEKIT